jgi:hypothetical protein
VTLRRGRQIDSEESLSAMAANVTGDPFNLDAGSCDRYLAPQPKRVWALKVLQEVARKCEGGNASLVAKQRYGARTGSNCFEVPGPFMRTQRNAACRLNDRVRAEAKGRTNLLFKLAIVHASA